MHKSKKIKKLFVRTAFLFVKILSLRERIHFENKWISACAEMTESFIT